MNQPTQILPMDAPSQLQALELLRVGQVIAFPTDTVYGVGADGQNGSAIEALYVVKDRPANKAIPLLLAEVAQAEEIAAGWSESARRLARLFWPGALTLVVRAGPELPPVLLGENHSIALRIPNQDWLRELIRKLGGPLATTSANRSGSPDTFTAAEVSAQLGGRLPLIIDGGRTPGSRASTVVDLLHTPPRVLRLGGISRSDLEQVLPELTFLQSS